MTFSQASTEKRSFSYVTKKLRNPVFHGQNKVFGQTQSKFLTIPVMNFISILSRRSSIRMRPSISGSFGQVENQFFSKNRKFQKFAELVPLQKVEVDAGHRRLGRVAPLRARTRQVTFATKSINLTGRRTFCSENFQTAKYLCKNLY